VLLSRLPLRVHSFSDLLGSLHLFCLSELVGLVLLVLEIACERFQGIETSSGLHRRPLLVLACHWGLAMRQEGQPFCRKIAVAIGSGATKWPQAS